MASNTEKVLPEQDQAELPQALEILSRDPRILPVLHKLAESKKQKDIWDKLSTMSTFFGTVVLAAVALVATTWINARSAEHEKEIKNLDVLSKFMPYLLEKDEDKKEKALLYINALAGTEFASSLARANPSSGPLKALHQIKSTAIKEADRQVAGETVKDIESFLGKARRAARTSISSGPVESFGTTKDLLATLPSEEAMHNRFPPIRTDPDSPRVSEEERNVSVKGYMHAIAREASNDYAIIIGPAKAEEGGLLFAVISGIPTNATPPTPVLIRARQEFKDFFGTALPERRYTILVPPAHVTVTGSLYYNVLHPPGALGPRALAPRTSWEIHPVTQIRFGG